MSKKNRHFKGAPYVCPHCGCNDENIIEDIEMNAGCDDRFNIYDFISVKLYCEHCGRGYTDFYRIKYDGFATAELECNKNGKIIAEYP